MKEPRFVKVYIDNICTVRGLTTTQTKIYLFMLQHLNDENVSVYGAEAKDEFLNENKITRSTFNNNTSVLIRSGLIDRIGFGEYKINNYYAEA